jgi:hypothetical protein
MFLSGGDPKTSIKTLLLAKRTLLGHPTAPGILLGSESDLVYKNRSALPICREGLNPHDCLDLPAKLLNSLLTALNFLLQEAFVFCHESFVSGAGFSIHPQHRQELSDFV